MVKRLYVILVASVLGLLLGCGTTCTCEKGVMGKVTATCKVCPGDTYLKSCFKLCKSAND